MSVEQIMALTRVYAEWCQARRDMWTLISFAVATFIAAAVVMASCLNAAWKGGVAGSIVAGITSVLVAVTSGVMAMLALADWRRARTLRAGWSESLAALKREFWQ